MKKMKNGAFLLLFALFWASLSVEAQTYPAPDDFKVFVQPSQVHKLQGKNATQILDSLKNGESVDFKLIFSHDDTLALDSIIVDLVDNSGPSDTTVSHEVISLKSASFPSGIQFTRNGKWCILNYSAFALRRKLRIEVKLVDNNPSQTSQNTHQFQL